MSKPQQTEALSETKEINASNDKEIKNDVINETKEKTPPTKEQIMKSLTAKIKRVKVQLQKYNAKLEELKATLESEREK